jgi:hypothetical protein
LLIGLYLNQHRVRTRQSYVALCGARDAFGESVPAQYFEALYDDPEEAKAQHAMHVSRVRFESARSQERHDWEGG